MLSYRQLEHFVTVAQELHFSRAADKLGVAQSAVSVQVQQLEQQLGVRLLERSGVIRGYTAIIDEPEARDTVTVIVQNSRGVPLAAETPFFPADGQVVILNRLHRETVLSQPNGGFFKVTKLRGSVLIVHCEVLLVSKKISRSILKCSGRLMN